MNATRRGCREFGHPVKAHSIDFLTHLFQELLQAGHRAWGLMLLSVKES
jgi:hypothetical protein